MASVFHHSTGQWAYADVVQQVLKKGHLRSPRGQETLDLGYTVIELESPLDALPLHTGRNLNPNIAAAEAVQLIGAFSDPDLLIATAPGFAKFTESSGRFHGSYGERVGNQVQACIRKLKADPNTRQAIIQLWDWMRDNNPGKKDYPCTVALQLELVDDRLCMNVVMRSNDAWLGLPYDLFQFTQLQMTVARALAVPCGTYRHTTFSLHLYEQHWTLAEELHLPLHVSFQPVGIGTVGIGWLQAQMRARQLPLVAFPLQGDATESERWYRGRFATYVGRDVDARSTDDSEEEPV